MPKYCLTCWNEEYGTAYRKKDVMIEGHPMRCECCGRLREDIVICVYEKESFHTDLQQFPEFEQWILLPLRMLDGLLGLLWLLLSLPYRCYKRKKQAQEEPSELSDVDK
ncbi:MAG: hypothetical protein IJW71_06705 [Clostridia bacterium]|nr:hypothetical protein [Clostridia bacterium]